MHLTENVLLTILVSNTSIMHKHLATDAASTSPTEKNPTSNCCIHIARETQSGILVVGGKLANNE